MVSVTKRCTSCFCRVRNAGIFSGDIKCDDCAKIKRGVVYPKTCACCRKVDNLKYNYMHKTGCYLCDDCSENARSYIQDKDSKALKAMTDTIMFNGYTVPQQYLDELERQREAEKLECQRKANELERQRKLDEWERQRKLNEFNHRRRLDEWERQKKADELKHQRKKDEWEHQSKVDEYKYQRKVDESDKSVTCEDCRSIIKVSGYFKKEGKCLCDQCAADYRMFRMKAFEKMLEAPPEDWPKYQQRLALK